MDAASSSLWATLGLLIALGFRHGMDPDHIATIDGLTRLRFQAHAYWAARLTGLQFACGHSLMILLATSVFYWQGVQLPAWLDELGLWVSSAFLLWLAVLNLRHCFGARAHTHAHGPVAGSMAALVLRFMGPLAHPVGVGFAFAISLDSLAQAGLMAAKGHALGGYGMVFLLAACFGLGMMLADTGNGLLMHWLVRRSERMAQQAGRIMSGVVAGLALIVVGVSHSKAHFAHLEVAWEAYGLWIGAGITLTLLGVYAVSRWHFQRQSRQSAKTLNASTLNGLNLSA
jgi:nickel/cobalt transporter (NiCoT) family protein